MAEPSKPDKIKELARRYYKRIYIQKALAEFARNREVVPSYMMEHFGQRPDTIEYESDVAALAEKGATSFHCSEELWQNPLELSTELSQEQLNNLRIGWDLILDLDAKYLDYSKIAAELLIEALRFHNINSLGLKYTGGKGFHIAVPSRAFPERIGDIETRKFFPAGPRAIASYLKEMIFPKLIERIRELDESLKYLKVYDKEAAEKLIDIILVSPRHLFRMPYSLHERTGLASIVIKPEQLKNFRPSWARSEIVSPKPFLPQEEKIEKNEARELLVQALDWQSRSKQATEKQEKEKKFAVYKEIILKDLTPNLYPPCITYILKGLKHDGRKRALFILLNFFKSLKLSPEEIEKRIAEWNKKNLKPLKEGYVKGQLSWFKRGKPILPPNCDKSIYKEIASCHADNLCRLIKNPVNYTVRKARLQRMQEGKPKTRTRKKRG